MVVILLGGVRSLFLRTLRLSGRVWPSAVPEQRHEGWPRGPQGVFWHHQPSCWLAPTWG